MVVDADAAPVRFTVMPAMDVPVPLVVIVPEIEKVPAAAVPTKFCPVTFALFIVTVLLTGVKANPAGEGVTV